MVKKYLSIIAQGAVLGLLLCGCSTARIGGFSIDEKNTAENYCEYSVINIEASTQIKPSIPREYYNYYDTKDDSKKYLAVKFDVKNLTSKDIAANEFMNAQFTIGDSKYQVASMVESDDGSQLLSTEDTKVTAGGDKKIIFISKIPSWCLENDITMELDIAGKRYRTSFNLDNIDAERVYNNTGEDISGDDGIAINCSSVKYVDSLKPSCENYGDFKSFKPKDDNHVFVLVDGTVKNNGSEAVKASDVLNIRTVSDKKYDSTKLMEVDDGKDIDYVDELSLEPGSSQRILYLMEVPADCKDGEAFVEINFKNDKHYIRIEK